MIPLSFAQQRLSFLAQVEGPSATYNIPVALRLEGELDTAALAAAIADVAARHEVLRTVYRAVAGLPCQLVLPADQAPRLVLAAGEEEPGAAVARVAEEGFDLAAAPPWRAVLAGAGPGVHVLVVVLHHIAGDGWSLGLLARDISVAYTARRAGREPGWPALPVQYADYAIWQRELLGEEDDPGSLLAQQVGWWRRVLDGAPPELALPADRPRPDVASHRGHQVPVAVPAGVHAQLAVLAREHGVTMFMLVQAAVAVLLSKLGAGTDVPVGTVTAGRTDAAVEDLVGFFVNTLVLRTDLAGDPSFAGLLGRIREAALGALDHQDVPFERLVEVLAPERSLARHPLFQVMVTVANNAPAVLDLSGLRVGGLAASIEAARFDLEVDIAEASAPDGGAGGLRGSVTVTADLFDPATATLIAARLGRVLAAVAAGPDTRLREVQVLDPAERAQVVAGWNDTAVPVPAGTLVDLLAARVAERPDAVAVACGDVALSYAGLWARAGRLAGRLAAAGAGPEQVVGLLLERGAELITAIAGVLRAGAAYLPLDPAYPAQ